MKEIAFEVNITSNEYLLGQTLRQGDAGRPLCLDGLIGKVPIILATDDDGVWPIDHCAFVHPGHHSLTAEYCRAISSGLINDATKLEKILKDTKDFCFWKMGGKIHEPNVSRLYPLKRHALSNNLIIHPDILKHLQKLCDDEKRKTGDYNTKFSLTGQYIDATDWKYLQSALRVVFVCLCTSEITENAAQKLDELRSDYDVIFKPVIKDFDTIYRFWKDIRSEFISGKPTAVSHNDIKIGHQVTLKFDGKTYLIYTNPKQGRLRDLPEECLCEFIYQKRRPKHTICAFVDAIDTKKIVELLENRMNSSASKEYDEMSLFIYTNTNIYEYVSHKIEKEFILTINPHSSKRKTDKQCFLYALCSCASAATAALHLIAEKISGEQPSHESQFSPGQAHPTDSIASEPQIPVSQDAADDALQKNK